MAGSISLSLTQQFNSLGEPLNGGLLYFYAAGTTNPQSAYQDYGLTIPWPNPITLDAAGRIPQLFFADGYIKVRLTDSAGVVQINSDFVLVIGPSSGGGGGGGVDPTTIFTTGDLKHMYNTGNITGWVRCNGRTIGSATSGATERANADTQTLFEFLWQIDSNLAVSGGRGVSSTADWGANKNIALPDMRGRVLAGLDDMGNSAAGRLTSSYFGSTATTLGASGGSQSHTLDATQIPSLSGTTGGTGTSATFYVSDFAITNGGGAPSTTTNAANISISSGSSAKSMTVSIPSLTATINATGTYGQAHNNVQPALLATIYMKL